MWLKNRKHNLIIFLLPICFFAYIFSSVIPDSVAQKNNTDLTVDKRDPFIALVTKDGRLIKFDRKSSGQVEVEGIIYDAQGVSYVIVNKEIVGIGDWIGDHQVYKIEKEKVIFLKEGKELVIELKEEIE